MTFADPESPDLPPQRLTIAFASGDRKHDAVVAALRGSGLPGLITDEQYAKATLVGDA
ncbi:sugar-binding domain-containing protein [Mycetohabitans sp. B46]|uniref:sugar-binding domain-containing protein n=1 Tax=Mycetohabitans sp. B46 TaxID=2772536 RepID=UPI003FCF8981